MSTTPMRPIGGPSRPVHVHSKSRRTRPTATVVVWWRMCGGTPGKSPLTEEVARPPDNRPPDLTTATEDAWPRTVSLRRTADLQAVGLREARDRGDYRSLRCRRKGRPSDRG